METKKKIWLFLAIGHLTLAACGAAHVPWWKLGSLGDWIQQFGVFTGSSSVFSFFAPGVGQSNRAEFDLYDDRGQFLATDTLLQGRSHEANLRIDTLIGFIVSDLDDNNSRHLLSASWAGKMFARHPEASSIVLRVETYDVPTMQEYREGVRYDWETIYRAKFEHAKPSKNE